MSNGRFDEEAVEERALELYDAARERIARGERFFRLIYLFGDRGVIKAIDLWGLTKATAKGVVAYQTKEVRPYAIVHLAVAPTSVTRVHATAGRLEPVPGAHLVAAVDYKRGNFKLWMGRIESEGKGANTQAPSPMDGSRPHLRAALREFFEAARHREAERRR